MARTLKPVSFLLSYVIPKKICVVNGNHTSQCLRHQSHFWITLWAVTRQPWVLPHATAIGELVWKDRRLQHDPPVTEMIMEENGPLASKACSTVRTEETGNTYEWRPQWLFLMKPCVAAAGLESPILLSAACVGVSHQSWLILLCTLLLRHFIRFLRQSLAVSFLYPSSHSNNWAIALKVFSLLNVFFFDSV